MGLVLGQESSGTFGTGFQPIYQEIKGLPSNQHGFVITQPSYQKYDSRVLTQEQQIQINAQEAFRKAVEEANRLRINGGVVRQFQETQTGEPQVQLVKENSINNRELESQQLPQEEGLIQQSSSERFESFRSPPAEIIAQAPNDNEFNEEISAKAQYDAKILREQAENAHYSFKSAVADSINDHSHIRQEIRNGPQINPLGQADVSSQIAGRSLAYTIKGADLPSPVQNKSIIN
ncbi:hypothetical protein O3M35_005474 [Rhynocoris fuscipes]|uniref:Uncharacterized protein n=1 Tax=Rhynocoris fuscipes TaxID=488301 RepID=A0AAW1DNQ1_9HEMI